MAKRQKRGLIPIIGRRIRVLRQDAGLTQAALAEKAGINDKYVGDLERGERDIRITTLGRLAKALKVPVADILREAEQDRLMAEIEGLIAGHDDVVRAHIIRQIRDTLLLLEAARR